MIDKTSNEWPLVSIIIPTYNRGHLVGRAIESALAQSYSKIEVLVVNNGSMDNTAEVLKPYEVDNRFRVVTIRPNGGVYKAYNTALPLVRGKYATFLYDDDTFLPDAIEVLVRKAEELGPSVGLIFGNCIDPETHVLTGSGIETERVVTYEDAMSGRISGEYSGIWRMDVFGDRRFEEDSLGGESLIWYDMYRHTNGYYINRPVRQYFRYRADSISLPKFDARSIERIAATYVRNLEIFGDDMQRISIHNYARMLRNAAIWSILCGKRWQAVHKLHEAFIKSHSLTTALELGLMLAPKRVLKWAIKFRLKLKQRKSVSTS